MRRVLFLVVLIAVFLGTQSFQNAIASGNQPTIEVARVISVVNGNTLDVHYENNSSKLPARVRAYLIDAPNINDSLNCFGLESKRFTEDLLLNRTIWISHVNHQDADGNLLAFLYLDSNLSSFVQAIIVSQGWARVYVRYSEELPYRDPLEKLQLDAQKDRRGIWGKCPSTSLPVSETTRVTINELEQNPAGQDTDKEWIELFNFEDSELDLGNWSLIAKEGSYRTYNFPTSTKISAHGFLLVHLPGIFLQNQDEIVELRNSAGVQMDQTPSAGLDDRYDDNRCWARVPNGSNQWKFRECTPGGGNGG
jgi:endonuclease YncB( thermonuclease family)